MAMASRGPCPMLLLSFALLAAGLALANGQPWLTLRKKFIKEHVDFPRTTDDIPSGYCEDMMYKRGVYGKRRNTFIHAPVRKITHVCSLGGIHISTGLRKSILHFKVTTCFLKPRSSTYKEKSFSRSIVIACWNKLPVLYVE